MQNPSEDLVIPSDQSVNRAYILYIHCSSYFLVSPCAWHWPIVAEPLRIRRPRAMARRWRRGLHLGDYHHYQPHHEHIKTVTIEKKIPVPYTVTKHVPYTVEKKVSP